MQRVLSAVFYSLARFLRSRNAVANGGMRRSFSHVNYLGISYATRIYFGKKGLSTRSVARWNSTLKSVDFEMIMLAVAQTIVYLTK